MDFFQYTDGIRLKNTETVQMMGVGMNGAVQRKAFAKQVGASETYEKDQKPAHYPFECVTAHGYRNLSGLFEISEIIKTTVQ